MGNLIVPLNKSTLWPYMESYINHLLSERLFAALDVA